MNDVILRIIRTEIYHNKEPREVVYEYRPFSDVNIDDKVRDIQLRRMLESMPEIYQWINGRD
jgi:hypothetical protein